MNDQALPEPISTVSEKPLPASILTLARELGLDVVRDEAIFFSTDIGAGFIASYWMCQGDDHIIVDISLDRYDVNKEPICELTTAVFDAPTEQETEKLHSVDEQSAREVIIRWAALHNVTRTLGDVETACNFSTGWQRTPE